MTKFITASLLGLALLTTGCTTLVPQSTLEQRTAFALGLKQGEFTIGDRQEGALRLDYTVTAKNGDKFNCYVTSNAGIFTSDALCSKPGGGAAEVQCNALLRAAGRCK